MGMLHKLTLALRRLDPDNNRRLMKEENLSGSVKRVCQTTRSLEGSQPWVNRIQTLEISRENQVWVGDITYVRLKRCFIYVALLMDVFTRMIRAWQVSRHLTQSLTLQPLQHALCQAGSPEIHHSDQGVQYLLLTLLIYGLINGGTSLSIRVIKTFKPSLYRHPAHIGTKKDNAKDRISTHNQGSFSAAAKKSAFDALNPYCCSTSRIAISVVKRLS